MYSDNRNELKTIGANGDTVIGVNQQPSEQIGDTVYALTIGMN